MFTDIGLIKNNAKTAAEIAVALSKLEDISTKSPIMNDDEIRPVGF